MSDLLPEQLLKSALSYAARGWLVFPLKPGTKAPLRGGNGCHDATSDPETIRSWWRETPTANIGIRAGRESGLFVLDVDLKKGKDGAKSLKALEAKHGEMLPATFAVITPSNGRHYYFRLDGNDVRNSVSKIGAGLDVRGEGGYVVAPPSIVDNAAYKIVNSTPPAIPPSWLVQAASATSIVQSASANLVQPHSANARVQCTDTIGYGVTGSGSSVPSSNQPFDSDFTDHVARAIDEAISAGGPNHNAIIPRAVGGLLGLRRIENGLAMPPAQKVYFADRLYSKMKTKGLVTKPKAHYIQDVIKTLNNPKFKSSNPVPAALIHARSSESPPELRSAEMLFEDENGRDEQFMFYLRLCYWVHVVNGGEEWGVTWREVAREIFGDEERYREVGAWQEILEGYGIIKRVREAVKGRNSRCYLWVWESSVSQTAQ